MARRSSAEAILMFGALLGFLLTYAVPSRYNTGPEGRWWERVRRISSRLFGFVDENGGPRPITAGEYAGRFDRNLDAVEALLYSEGFVRNPMSRLKIRDGSPEDGSWVYRDTPLAPRQLHLMLFGNGDGTTDVYAHAELSSVNPLCGPAHFQGPGQSVREGVDHAREWFDLDTSEATAEPPEGSWDQFS